MASEHQVSIYDVLRKPFEVRDGEIYFQGRRVTLVAFLRELLKSRDPDALSTRFPTLERTQVRDAMEFCDEHADLLQTFFHEKLEEWNNTANSADALGPRAAELRRRLS